MKRSFIIAIKEFLSRRSKKPWACFETTGPLSDGRVEFSISCNNKFIENVQRIGLAGQTDEETAQLFFLSAQMVPEELMNRDEDAVNPDNLPNLTNEANEFRRGDIKRK